jgi:Glycosyltransferase family 87
VARSRTSRAIRLARILALAVIIGVGISELYFAITGWTQNDAGAYWNAAMRLRDHQPLYPVVADVEASDVYRYAPWLAWLTVPFTYLPVQVAGAIWSVFLLAGSVLAVLPLARRGAWVPVAFFFPILVGISAYGNVQALLIASLVWSVDRRSGPVWVGVAASLKIFPILFAVTYLVRGQWLRALVAVVVGGLLWAPALLYDLTGYVTEPGQAGLFGSTLVWSVVAVGAVLVTAWLARTRYGLLSAAGAVILTAPRFFIYDVTYLLAGADAGGTPSESAMAPRWRTPQTRG